MAKKPKKAPAAEGEAGVEAPKSKKKLIIIAAAAVLAVGGGGGAFLMMGHGGGHGEAAAGGHGGHGEAAHGAAPDAKKPQVVFLDVREMVLNLSPEATQDKAKYAKLRISLELKDNKVEEELKPLMPRVEDALQIYMREMRAADLSGSIALYRLREELLRRINVAVYPAKVEAVLFKDLIVQ